MEPQKSEGWIFSVQSRGKSSGNQDFEFKTQIFLAF